jgi:hypothetical protein
VALGDRVTGWDSERGGDAVVRLGLVDVADDGAPGLIAQQAQAADPRDA